MAQVVAVHGIAQEFHNEDLILNGWGPAIRGSLKLVGYTDPVSIELAFYGDLYRRKGTMAVAPPAIAVEDLSQYEGELLIELWKEAARTHPGVMGPRADTMLYVPDMLRRACNALSGIPLVSGLVERTAILWFVRQVYRYFHEPELRAEARKRVTAKIKSDTRVVVAHSLGSVVAYEALCALPNSPVRALVTIGSPLGIRNLIFDRLDPSPKDGSGLWPTGLTRWTNISAKGDFVALERRLASRFDSRIEDHPVDNARDAHDALRYLTSVEAAQAIRDGLAADGPNGPASPRAEGSEA